MENAHTLLQLTTRQCDMHGEVETQKKTHRAQICVREGEICLAYREDDAQTQMCFREDFVEITRQGEATTHLILQTGKTHTDVYRTHYGDLEIKAHTHRILSMCAQARCEVRMEYDIYLSGELAYSNEVTAVFRR